MSFFKDKLKFGCNNNSSVAEETRRESSAEPSAMSMETRSLYDKRIWRVGDVAKFLGCSKGHIYNLASEEKIPKRKKHGLLVFIPEEILNWVLEGDEQ